MKGQTSPRMGHTLGEIFTHAQSLNFKNRNSWAGRKNSVLVDHPCAAGSRASPCPISAGCCMQAAAETTACGSTGKEDLKADRPVRHYKGAGLPEWPLAGRATVPRGLYGISLCMSLRRRTPRFFQKVYRHPLPSTSPFTLFARLTEPQVVILP